jgi:hypothetical protein
MFRASALASDEDAMRPSEMDTMVGRDKPRNTVKTEATTVAHILWSFGLVFGLSFNP